MKKLMGVLVSILLFGTVSVFGGELSAYLKGDYQSAENVESQLKKGGFEVLASYPSVEEGRTIVFTCKGLQKAAAKPGRAHAGILRVFVDDTNKGIRFTNPLYFGRAFMQDDYNEKVFSMAKAKIEKVFGPLHPSKDALDADDLAGYHFMMGMPYYEDKEVLAEGDTKELLAKIKAHNPVFILKLSDDSYLVGVALKDTSFVEKIGRANATVLPYCVAIEDGKATMLNAKYYLAISYPSLSMGEFMTISDVPDHIEEELKKNFE